MSDQDLSRVRFSSLTMSDKDLSRVRFSSLTMSDQELSRVRFFRLNFLGSRECQGIPLSSRTLSESVLFTQYSDQAQLYQIQDLSRVSFPKLNYVSIKICQRLVFPA